jgi:hypothetical protein
MAGGRGVFLVLALGFSVSRLPAQIGREAAVPVHLRDGEEFTIPLRRLLNFGEAQFTANWTVQEGGGRPLTKGTGVALTDPGSPLTFPRNSSRARHRRSSQRSK